jgi:hypothetical protein
MIIHLIHCNAEPLRTGSLLLLAGLRAHWIRIRTALRQRIDRRFARWLRHHTAYIRSIHGRTPVALPDPRKGAAEHRIRRSPLPIR